MKKIGALLTVIMLVFTLAACGGNEKNPSPSQEVTYSGISEESITESTVSADITEETTQAVTENISEVSEETTTQVQSLTDPSQWSKEEIVEFYKKAAAKTHPKAKSTQVMVLNELIINDGDGALGFFIKILEPAIASVVEKNAFVFDGVTGGFANLTASDIQNVKAYNSDGYTVIEMEMKPQTDGKYAEEYEGSVGHAITVLGDVSKVLTEFPQFKVDLDNADVVVNYVNPTVKVRVNKDGIIDNGTWKYTCDPEIRNITISGITIRKADAKIDYIITVGDGF